MRVLLAALAALVGMATVEEWMHVTGVERQVKADLDASNRGTFARSHRDIPLHVQQGSSSSASSSSASTNAANAVHHVPGHGHVPGHVLGHPLRHGAAMAILDAMRTAHINPSLVQQFTEDAADAADTERATRGAGTDRALGGGRSRAAVAAEGSEAPPCYEPIHGRDAHSRSLSSCSHIR